MPTAFRVTLHFPSRRWGSGSHIEVEFSELGIIVETGPKRTQHLPGTPGWSGHGGHGPGGHALAGLFVDEGIKGDKVVESTVERIWAAWKDDRDAGATSKAKAGLEEFRAWVEAGARPASRRGQ